MVRSLLDCTVLPHMAVRDELSRGSLVVANRTTDAARNARDRFPANDDRAAVMRFVDVVRDVVMALAKDGT
jgi:hypothetical protein